GTDTDCGTTACAAGWGVRFTPPGVLAACGWTWWQAGVVAFGLEPDLARAIFAGTFAPESMPDCLRAIAALPEGGRTVRALVDAGWKDWREADLSGVDLTNAVLAGAYLAGAYLAGADLTGVNLTRATLYGAHLTGVDLTGAIGVVLPDGWRLDHGRAVRA
ncbi:MAG TPA: pentapeptide repeat-containing protein, partial [Actinotalea sp.]|nr:pentapeptide repeat-containing protein [Actinotalea sp.]